MNHRHVENFLIGRSIRVGTFREFRGTEDRGTRFLRIRYLQAEGKISRAEAEEAIDAMKIGDNGGIIDGREASTETYVRNAVWSGNVADQYPSIAPFMGRGNPTNFTLRDSILVDRIPNHYVFCAAQSATKEVIEGLKKDSSKIGGRPYDVGVPILNIPLFAKLVGRAIYGSRKITDQNLRYKVAPVRYESRTASENDTVPLRANIFIKDPAFFYQDELRLVWDKEINSDELSFNFEVDKSVRECFGTPFPI